MTVNEIEIEQALRQADDIAISEEVDCSDVLNYIEELKTEMDELKAMHTFVMKVKKDDLDFSFNSEAADMFLSQVIQLFKQNDAKNFLSMTVGDPENEEARYSVTIQKAGSMTPVERLNKIREELSERLKAACTFDGRRSALDKNKIDEIIEEVYGL